MAHICWGHSICWPSLASLGHPRALERAQIPSQTCRRFLVTSSLNSSPSAPNVDVTIPIRTFPAATLPHVSQIGRHPSACHTNKFVNITLKVHPAEGTGQDMRTQNFQITHARVAASSPSLCSGTFKRFHQSGRWAFMVNIPQA